MRSRLRLAALRAPWASRAITAPLVSLLILHAAEASASEYSQPGVYLTVGGFNAFQQFEASAASEPVDATFEDALGFQARVGYRLTSILAGEIQGDFNSGFRTLIPAGPDNPDLPVGTLVPFDLEHGIISFNAKAIAPLGRFEPYALVGIGGMWTNLVTGFDTGVACGPGWYWGWWCTGVRTRVASGGGFISRFGGGFDVWVTEDLAVTVDASYVLPTGEISPLEFWTLNWGAKFKY